MNTTTRRNIFLFDIDGTLLDTGGAGLAAMEATLESEFGFTVQPNEIATAGRTDRAIVVDLMTSYGMDEVDAAVERFRNAYLRHLPQSLEQRAGLILPGVPELLKKLTERPDVLVGLLTGNFQEGARLKLDHYDLAQYFSFGGFGDHCLDRNGVAHAALAETYRCCDGSLSLDRVWVVGDTPADIACARAIGVKVIAVGTGILSSHSVRATQPDYFFDDLSEPDRVLQVLDDSNPSPRSSESIR